MSPSEADRAAETTEVTVIGEGPKGREEERPRGAWGQGGVGAGWAEQARVLWQPSVRSAGSIVAVCFCWPRYTGRSEPGRAVNT